MRPTSSPNSVRKESSRLPSQDSTEYIRSIASTNTRSSELARSMMARSISRVSHHSSLSSRSTLSQVRWYSTSVQLQDPRRLNSPCSWRILGASLRSSRTRSAMIVSCTTVISSERRSSLERRPMLATISNLRVPSSIASSSTLRVLLKDASSSTTRRVMDSGLWIT
jgi:hypothetical protein